MTGHDPLSICRRHGDHLTYRRSRGCSACRAEAEVIDRDRRIAELSEVVKTLEVSLQNANAENMLLRDRVTSLERRTSQVAPQILSLVSDLGASPESTNGEFSKITNEIFTLAGDLALSVDG